MTGKAVETVAPASVPALYRPPAIEISAEDVVLPRIYLGQYMTEAVKHKLVDFGDIFAASGPDDPDPTVLHTLGSDDGPIVLVLAMKRGKSYSEDGGELELYDYDDPAAPAEAWITYNYTVCLPDVDEEVPFKWLLTRTGRPAAQQINTVLKKNEGRGPAWHNAFKITTVSRENKKGEYVVPRVASVEPSKTQVEIAEKLAVMISGVGADVQATGEEPAI